MFERNPCQSCPLGSASEHAIQSLSVSFAETRNTDIAGGHSICYFPLAQYIYCGLIWKENGQPQHMFQPSSVAEFWLVSAEQLLKSQLLPKPAAKRHLRWPPVPVLLPAPWDALPTFSTSSVYSSLPKGNNQQLVPAWQPVASRVPWRLILGPILFNVFINDLENDTEHTLCKLEMTSDLERGWDTERQNFSPETPG